MLANERYGRLMVMDRIQLDNRPVTLQCVCDCGKEYIGRLYNIAKAGDYASCGCSRKRATPGKKFDASKSYGRWRPDGHPFSKSGVSYISCVCSCGNRKDVSLGNLKSGSSKSCGCLLADVTRTRSRLHGKSRTIEYIRWSMHIGSATKQENGELLNRFGIPVDERWAGSFTTFLSEMGECPKVPVLNNSLVRQDIYRGYEPGNLVWGQYTTPVKRRVRA